MSFYEKEARMNRTRVIRRYLMNYALSGEVHELEKAAVFLQGLIEVEKGEHDNG